MRVDLLPLGLEMVVANLLIGVFWFAFLLIPLYFPGWPAVPGPRQPLGQSPGQLDDLFFAGDCQYLQPPGQSGAAAASQVSVPNPFFVFAWNYTVVTIPMMVSLIIAGIVTVILRYRGSRELERLQLRWLLFGVLVQGVLTILTFWAPPGSNSSRPGSTRSTA